MTDLQLRVVSRLAKRMSNPNVLESLREYTGMEVAIYGGPLPRNDLLVLFASDYMESDPYVFDEHGNQLTDEAVYEAVREQIHEDVLDRFARVSEVGG